MEGILKRRGAENAEEVFQKELCGLCDSAFPICKTPIAPNQPISFRKLVQKYESPIRGNTFVDIDSQGFRLMALTIENLRLCCASSTDRLKPDSA